MFSNFYHTAEIEKASVKILSAELLRSDKIKLSRLADNSKSSRRLKIDITCKKKQYYCIVSRQTFSGDYSQEFVIGLYNETGIDIS